MSNRLARISIVAAATAIACCLPALTAAANPTDAPSPTPAAASATPSKPAQPAPKDDDKSEPAQPTPSQVQTTRAPAPEPSKADPTKAPAPKSSETATPTKAPTPTPSPSVSQTEEPTPSVTPSQTTSPTSTPTTSETPSATPKATSAWSCEREAGKLTGNVLVSPTLDNRGVDVRTPFAVTVTDGSGADFTSPQNLQPGELRPLEPSAFPAGGDFSVVIKANGVKVFSDTFNTDSCKLPAKIKVTAVNGTFTDECGPDFNLKFTPAVTEGVEYVQVREGNTLKVTAEVTDAGKYELTNPDWTQSKTDGLEACPVVAPKASLVVACERDEKGEVTGWVEAELTLDNTQFESASTFLVHTTWPGDQVDSDLVVGPQATETFWGYFPAGGVLRNIVMWGGQVILEQTDSTQQCVVKESPSKPKPSKPKPTKATKTDKSSTWSDTKTTDRGLPKDTGPGEEFVSIAEIGPFVVSPSVLGIVGGSLIVGGLIVGGVLVLRRREA